MRQLEPTGRKNDVSIDRIECSARLGPCDNRQCWHDRSPYRRCRQLGHQSCGRLRTGILARSRGPLPSDGHEPRMPARLPSGGRGQEVLAQLIGIIVKRPGPSARSSTFRPKRSPTTRRSSNKITARAQNAANDRSGHPLRRQACPTERRGGNGALNIVSCNGAIVIRGAVTRGDALPSRPWYRA